MEYQFFTYLKAMRTFLIWAQASFSAVLPSVSTAMMSMLGWQSNSWMTWETRLKGGSRWTILLLPWCDPVNHRGPSTRSYLKVNYCNNAGYYIYGLYFLGSPPLRYKIKREKNLNFNSQSALHKTRTGAEGLEHFML